jgi:hypothetical protein
MFPYLFIAKDGTRKATRMKLVLGFACATGTILHLNAAGRVQACVKQLPRGWMRVNKDQFPDHLDLDDPHQARPVYWFDMELLANHKEVGLIPSNVVANVVSLEWFWNRDDLLSYGLGTSE